MKHTWKNSRLEDLWLTILTAHTSISGAVTVAFSDVSTTVKETALSSNTSSIYQPAHSSSIWNSIQNMSSSSCSRKSKLSACNLGTSKSPMRITTHSAPDIDVADLHTSTSICASLQSDRSMSADFLTLD